MPIENADANFFSLVHHILEATRHQEDDDRRTEHRQRYAALQYMAPYRDGRLPVEAKFEQILCRDLSPSGFSYLAEEFPACEHLVVALAGDGFLFLTAQVMRRKQVQLKNKAMWLVGCRFLSRLENCGLDGSKLGAAVRA